MDKVIDINSVDGKAGYLGPVGTFTHQAVMLTFPDVTQIPHKRIGNMFSAVMRDEIDFCVVPSENISGGFVRDTMFGIAEFPELYVTGSFELPIRHCLLGRAEDMGGIEIITSKDNAIWQCSQFIKEHCVGITIKEANSTTSAIPETEGDKSVAFIASKAAAEIYGLNVLMEDIGDNKANFTKFYIVSKGAIPEAVESFGKTKTFLLLESENRVGALADMLVVFKMHNLNLTYVQSMQIGNGEYRFFLDVEAAQEVVQGTTDELWQYCTSVRDVGVGSTEICTEREVGVG